MAHAGMRFLTENMVLTDGSRIYPISEPIRLTDEPGTRRRAAVACNRPGQQAQAQDDVPPPANHAAGSQPRSSSWRLSGTGFVRRFAAGRVPGPPGDERHSLTQRLQLVCAALDLLWPNP
jgi:hypothetical protein